MHLKPTLLFVLFVHAAIFLSYSQEVLPDTAVEYIFNPDHTPCITPEQYQQIDQQVERNLKLYGINDVLQRSTQATLFSWPLRAVGEAADECGYYAAMGYVDEDSTSPGTLDYNCGTRTYDGHRGTDIGFWPYPFYRIDNNQVEVIAAAPGRIIAKDDGHFDRNCGSSTEPPNYLCIQHADGSRAYYYHFKKNTMTATPSGQNVALGEFLGIAGSSGNSSAPHLHFELWNDPIVPHLEDPFAGNCNHFNNNSWWATQKAYMEPAINMIQVGHIAPVLPACPATETPNEDTCLARGVSAVFTVFMRQTTPGTTLNLYLRYSNSFSYTDQWTYTINNNWGSSYYSWTRTLPTSPAGEYEFKATYNGITCSKYFHIGSCAATTGLDDKTGMITAFYVYPNPTNGSFIVEIPDEATSATSIIEVYNNIGALVYSIPVTNIKTEISLNASTGIYYCRLRNSVQLSAPSKLLIY